MKQIILSLFSRQIYTTAQTIEFDATPGSTMEAYLKSGSGTYLFQNGVDPDVTSEVTAPYQTNNILQGGHYRLTITPKEPSEFSAILRKIIDDK